MIYNLPSSQFGLNISDPLDRMAETYAIQMDNLIPDTEGDKLRKGYVQRSSNPALTLIPVCLQGNEKIIGSYNGTLTVYQNFNVEQTKSGFLSDDWTYTPFTDGAGKVHTFMANGVDVPQEYSVSGETGTLADTTYTVPSGVLLDNPISFKNRLYFIGGDWDIYYSGVQSITGELTPFSVGSFFKKGGRILKIANWTQDSGSGSDDLFVIISTEGEVMVYQGTSPEAEDWRSLGVFQIARPISKRCTALVGGDLVVITQLGYIPLSGLLSDLRANRSGISQKVNGITKGRGTSGRWDIFFYPKEGWLIVNAPSSLPGYAYEQHVLNLATNGWCRFVGMDAYSWVVLFDKIYFCNPNGIFEANTGTTDNGGYITFALQKAYNTFNTPYPKQIMRLVPRYDTISNDTLYKQINADFQEATGKAMPSAMQNGYVTLWNEAIWDEDYWTTEQKAYKTRAAATSRAGSFLSVGYYGRTKYELTFYSTGLIIKQGTGHI